MILGFKGSQKNTQFYRVMQVIFVCFFLWTAKLKCREIRNFPEPPYVHAIKYIR